MEVEILREGKVLSKKNRHGRHAAFDILLWVAIGIAVLGGVLSFCLFAGSLTHFSIGYDKVYSALLDQLEKNLLPAPTPDPNAPTLDPNDVDLPVESVSDSSKIIAELTKLHELQAQVNGKDLIVFLYQFISAVLIGVATKMAADTRKNQRSVEESCEEARKLANKASSQINWNDAKTSLSTAYNMIVNCLSLLLGGNDANTVQSVSEILVCFNETLIGTLDRIKKMDSTMISKAETQYFEFILAHIKYHVGECNARNKTVVTDRYVAAMNADIDEVAKLLMHLS